MKRILRGSNGQCPTDHACGSFWFNTPARIFFLAAPFIAFALYLAMHASAFAQNTPLQPGSIHLTRAHMLDQPSTGFSPAPYTIEPAALAGPWTEVSLPHAAPFLRLKRALRLGESLSPTTTITWYRLQTNDLADVSGPRYLYVPRWKAAGRIAVYADSRLLYQTNSNLYSTPSNEPLWIPLDNYGDASPPATVTIRIQHLRDLDSALSSVWVGTADVLSWRYQWRTWLQNRLPLTSSAAFLAIGVFVLFVWRQHRTEKLYLLFTLTSVAVYIRSLRYYIGPDWVPLNDAWFSWADVNARFCIIALAHLILVQLHGRSRPWLKRTLIAATAASSLLTLPLFLALPNAGIVAPLTYLVLLVLALLVFGAGIWDAWQRHSRRGLLVAGWGLLGLVFGIHDWLMQNNLINIEHMLLGSFVNVGACLILMFLVFERYMVAIDDVAKANARLETRLRIREAELTTSHQRLREVEQRAVLSEERRRMTQDMHDGLGASLISALGSVERGRLSQMDVAEILKDCVEDLKLSIDSLEPVEADLLLLLGTLRFRIGPRLEHMGIALRWEVRDVPPLDWLEPRLSLHILRILQEAFTNIIKHAQATEIRVTTAEAIDGVTLCIIDNGVGFSLEPAVQFGGRGLQNQMRRAMAIGGRVEWSATERGTHFLLWLPTTRAPTGSSRLA